MNVTAFQDAYLRRIGVSTHIEEINTIAANALRFVIQHIFSKISNDFVFILSSSGGAVEFRLNDIMTKLFATWSFMAAQLVILDKNRKRLDTLGKRYCNMFMIDSLKSLERTNIAEFNRNSDSLEYYFIFLQMPDHLLVHEMTRIFKYCFDNYWIHCDVMIQNVKGEVYVYTYFPFKENHCFKTKPEKINKFLGEHFENEEMFPDKLRNLNKCSLKLTTWDIPPFVMNQSDYYEPERNISGFEIIAMLEISQKLNFTLDINMISIDTYRKNQTPATEPLEKVSNL